MSYLLSKARLLKNTLMFKELNLLQYRQLLKCFLGEEINTELIITNINNILKELTDLTLDEIENLDFIDFCLLLFHIRQVSIGDTVFLVFEENGKPHIKLNLQTSDVIASILKSEITTFLKTLKYNDLFITYKLPTIKEIIAIEKEGYSLYTFFIKNIKIKTTVINFTEYSYTDREKIVQTLPVKAIVQINKNVQEIICLCEQINLLESINTDTFRNKLPLAINSNIIAFIIKLIFNTNIESVYENIFALSKMAHISSTFLNTCSPGEFYLFTKKLEEVLSKQKNTNDNFADDSSLPPINSEFNVE